MAQIIPVSGVSQGLQQVASPVANAGGTEDLFNNLMKVIDGVNNIMGKWEKFSPYLSKIVDAKNDSVQSRGQSDNPVLQEKMEKREIGYNTVSVPMAKDAVEKPKQKINEVKEMKISDEWCEQFFKQAIKELPEKIPEDYKNKTIKELLEEYNNKSGVMKGLIDNFIINQIRGTIQACVDAHEKQQ